ncbi:hypothetical protein BCR44DRAFT_397295 [Catenaria anguillulae PL171]|uniref:BTB domain-containing protein n=1 Tax=Catenaria anguillulae PL171 TaxID=765915 RepID=A0A1Y2H3P8_9FUNG|nr:hypothetical protein BCR44DRAFT_397295 [Catenaria anguillulae PL171]
MARQVPDSDSRLVTRTHRTATQSFVIQLPDKDLYYFFVDDDPVHISFGRVETRLGRFVVGVRHSVAGSPFVVLCLYDKYRSLNGNTTACCAFGNRPSHPMAFYQPSALVIGAVVTATFSLPKYSKHVRHSFVPAFITVSIPSTAPPPKTVELRKIPANLIATLNSRALCDCTFTLENGIETSASKNVVVASSAFFETKFREVEWCTPGSTIAFECWSVRAALPCLVHMYNGWMPTDGDLPKPDSPRT